MNGCVDTSRASEADRVLERKRPRGHRRAVGAVLALLIAAGAGLSAPAAAAGSAAAAQHGRPPAHAAHKTHKAHKSPKGHAQKSRRKRPRPRPHSHPHHPSIRPEPARRRPTHHAAPSGSPIQAAPRAARGVVALHYAMSQVGKPYSYGAVGPDTYDCSGLTQRSWKAAGVSIPRTTQEQASFGDPVPLDRIQPGDLVIFYADASHVGIYSGDGKVVVAPHSGAVVRVESMRWMPVYAVRRPG